jgi:hypothetical protein
MADPTGNLRIQLMALLLSRPVQQINFRLGAYSVRDLIIPKLPWRCSAGKLTSKSILQNCKI